MAGPAQHGHRSPGELSANSAVQYAASTQMMQIATVPNDPSFTNGTQWGLNGTWGINAPTAWNTTTGSIRSSSPTSTPACNYNNPDLINNVWLNQAEIPASVKPNLTDVNGDGVITFADLNNAGQSGDRQDRRHEQATA